MTEPGTPGTPGAPGTPGSWNALTLVNVVQVWSFESSQLESTQNLQPTARMLRVFEVDSGTEPAQCISMGTGVRRYHDLIAWQLANAFKREVYRLLDAKRSVLTSWKLREQLADAAGGIPKDISEGFVRFSPAQFVRFLDYALASLVEAEDWLRDAVERKFLSAAEAQEGLTLAKRCWKASLELKHSQEREIERRRRQRRRRPPPDLPT